MRTHTDTIQTRTRKLVGTVAYRAQTRRMVPLADPTAWGNSGVEGFDEDSEGREFKTKAAAVRWLGSRLAADEHAYSGEVSKIEWEADEFEDDEYGLVLDGIETDTYRWYYCKTDNGAVCDDECDPR
jgi:hypothetical protein